MTEGDVQTLTLTILSESQEPTQIAFEVGANFGREIDLLNNRAVIEYDVQGDTHDFATESLFEDPDSVGAASHLIGSLRLGAVIDAEPDALRVLNELRINELTAEAESSIPSDFLDSRSKNSLEQSTGSHNVIAIEAKKRFQPDVVGQTLFSDQHPNTLQTELPKPVSALPNDLALTDLLTSDLEFDLTTLAD